MEFYGANDWESSLEKDTLGFGTMRWIDEDTPLDQGFPIEKRFGLFVLNYQEY